MNPAQACKVNEVLKWCEYPVDVEKSTFQTRFLQLGRFISEVSFWSGLKMGLKVSL